MSIPVAAAAARCKYAHRGDDGRLTEFSDADNQLIALATARGLQAVCVHAIHSSPSTA